MLAIRSRIFRLGLANSLASAMMSGDLRHWMHAMAGQGRAHGADIAVHVAECRRDVAAVAGQLRELRLERRA